MDQTQGGRQRRLTSDGGRVVAPLGQALDRPLKARDLDDDETTSDDLTSEETKEVYHIVNTRRAVARRRRRQAAAELRRVERSLYGKPPSSLQTSSRQT